MDPLSQLQDEQKKRYARMKIKETVSTPKKVVIRIIPQQNLFILIFHSFSTLSHQNISTYRLTRNQQLVN